MNSIFAKRQLEKQGWKEGDGLGRLRDGIQNPIKASLKMDKTGVGHDPGKEFTDHWWMRAFNDAAKKIKKSDQEPDNKEEESEESKRKAEMSEKKKNFYKGFIKASTLSNGEETKHPDHVSEDEEDEEKVQSSVPTLDDLHEFCGGATGHKAARFGIKMKGKLSRVAAHDKEFEETSKVQPGISYLKKRKHDDGSSQESKDSNDDEQVAVDSPDLQRQWKNGGPDPKDISGEPQKSWEETEKKRKKIKKKSRDEEEMNNRQSENETELVEETDKKKKKKKKIKNGEQTDYKQLEDEPESFEETDKTKKKKKLQHDKQNDDTLNREEPLETGRKKKKQKTEDNEQEDNKQKEAECTEVDKKKKKKRRTIETERTEVDTNTTKISGDSDNQPDASDDQQQETNKKKEKKKKSRMKASSDDSCNDEQPEKRKRKRKKRKHDNCSSNSEERVIEGEVVSTTVNVSVLADDSRVSGSAEVDKNDVKVNSSLNITDISRKKKKKSKNRDTDSILDRSLTVEVDSKRAGEMVALQEEDSPGAIQKVKKKKKKKNKDCD